MVRAKEDTGNEAKTITRPEDPACVGRIRLDLSGARVLVFRNSGSRGIDVTYRRQYSHIGWIDPD